MRGVHVHKPAFYDKIRIPHGNKPGCLFDKFLIIREFTSMPHKEEALLTHMVIRYADGRKTIANSLPEHSWQHLTMLGSAGTGGGGREGFHTTFCIIIPVYF